MTFDPNTTYPDNEALPNGPSLVSGGGPIETYGLGFSVSGKVKGGIGTIGYIGGDAPNKQNPTGTWRVEQLTQRYLLTPYKKVEEDKQLHRDLARGIPFSAPNDNFKWYDHPGGIDEPPLRRQNFVIRLTNGEKNCEVSFHFIQKGHQIHWGPGLLP